jgi:hypothetical protein
MNKKLLSITALTLLVGVTLIGAPALAEGNAPAALLGTGFTYQGQLQDTGGNPITSTCNFRFSLWDAVSGGNQIGANSNVNGAAVATGKFTLQVNNGNEFGNSAFSGNNARWLLVEVQCSGDPGFTTLTPRQPLTPAPYAMYAITTGSAPWSGLSGIPAGFADGVDNDTTYSAGAGMSLSSGAFSLQGGYRLPQTCSSGQSAEWNGSTWGCAAYATSGHNHWGTSWSGTGIGLTLSGGSTGLNATGNSYGVYGDSPGYGVFGSSTSGGYGVFGFSSTGTAVRAHGGGSGASFAALQAYNGNLDNGVAAYFENASGHPNTELDQNGSGRVLDLQNGGDEYGNGGGDFIAGYSQASSFDMQFRITSSGQGRSDVGWTTPAEDYAEMLPAVEGLAPGDVLVIGPDGKLILSTQAYQANVVGVYSTQPGFVGGYPVDGPVTGTIPLAIVGVVPVKVSTENGPIHPGDLLTTSTIPGFAMKASTVTVNGITFYPSGVLIGKALEGLDAGEGLILVLVTLQ